MSIKRALIFSNQDMPDSLKKQFEKAFRNQEWRNGSYSSWQVKHQYGPFGDPFYNEQNYGKEFISAVCAVDDWLLANGAIEGETAFLHYWW